MWGLKCPSFRLLVTSTLTIIAVDIGERLSVRIWSHVNILSRFFASILWISTLAGY